MSSRSKHQAAQEVRGDLAPERTNPPILAVDVTPRRRGGRQPMSQAQKAERVAARKALPQTLCQEQRLTMPQVTTLTGSAKSKLYALIAAGEFPAPERRGPRCSRWRAGDVLNWLDAQRASQLKG